MSRIVQQLRGNAAAAAAQVLPSGTLYYNTDLNELRIHDGFTAGGWIFQNVTQYAALGVGMWTAVAIFSTPGALPTTCVGKLTDLTVAGTYILPPVSNSNIGTQTRFRALIAGVILQRSGAEFINDIGVDQTTVTVSLNQIITLGKFDTTKYIVSGRY